MSEVLDAVAGARRALEGLLAILEVEAAGGEQLQGAAERCATSFERLTTELERAEQPDANQRGLLERELGELARLNALATSCAGEKRDEARALLRRARTERKSLDFYSPGGATGVSCDLSG